MSRIQCFFLEPTDRVQVKLRRYATHAGPCPHDPSKYSSHNTSTFLYEEPIEKDDKGYISNGVKPLLPKTDSRWPTYCTCGYIFQEQDEWQRFTETIYQRTDTHEEMTIRDAPHGAMWYAPWYDDFSMPQGPHNLVVKTPGGGWSVDGQASNCTIKEDVQQRQHHCWVRHGEPPTITVDKEGITCSAGAGSIQCGNYHGFLRNGYLED